MLEKKNSVKFLKKTLKRSERKKKTRKLVLFYSTLFFFIVLIYGYLLFSPFTKGTIVLVKDTVLNEKIKNEVLKKSEQKYLGIFPLTSLITPTMSPLERDIMSMVEEVETVNISRSFFSKEIQITFSLKKPVFLESNGDYLDTHNKSYKDERAPKLPLLKTNKSISDEDLTKLIFLKETIETALFPVETVDIDNLSDVVFTLVIDAHTKISFSLKQDEKEVWSKIVSALDTAPLKENKETFARVESLDIRFGNKIYYKIRSNDNMLIPENSATTTYERQ